MTKVRMVVTADADGMAHFDLPVGPAGSEVEIVVAIRPKTATDDGTPESRGWPPGFFEATYGSIQDPAFERPDQGTFEVQRKVQ